MFHDEYIYVNFINIKYYDIYGTIQIFQLSNYISKHVFVKLI